MASIGEHLLDSVLEYFNIPGNLVIILFWVNLCYILVDQGLEASIKFL